MAVCAIRGGMGVRGGGAWCGATASVQGVAMRGLVDFEWSGLGGAGWSWAGAGLCMVVCLLVHVDTAARTPHPSVAGPRCEECAGQAIALGAHALRQLGGTHSCLVYNDIDGDVARCANRAQDKPLPSAGCRTRQTTSPHLRVRVVTKPILPQFEVITYPAAGERARVHKWKGAPPSLIN